MVGLGPDALLQLLVWLADIMFSCWLCVKFPSRGSVFVLQQLRDAKEKDKFERRIIEV